MAGRISVSLAWRVGVFDPEGVADREGILARRGDVVRLCSLVGLD
jgi:hypothetical protein